MKTSKESLKVKESSDERKGQKYPSVASGGDLAQGLSHKKSAGDVDSMYRPAEDKQRAVKGHDRI